MKRTRQWHPTPVLLPGKSHGQRNLEGCSPWGRWGSDTTERLHFHFSLSCIGEGNGNPLQCSCLENPRDGGAWWAAVYGVTQSRTRLKWLSSSSSSNLLSYIINKRDFIGRMYKAQSSPPRPQELSSFQIMCLTIKYSPFLFLEDLLVSFHEQKAPLRVPFAEVLSLF